MKYLQPNLTKSTSTKRTANENIENTPPTKKTYTSTEVQTTQPKPNDITILPDIDLNQTTTKPNNDSTILPDLDWSAPNNDSTILPDIKLTPKAQRTLKPIQIDLTKDSNEDEKQNRAQRIVDKALEIRYGDHTDLDSPLWNGNNNGSKIQVLKIPKSLVRKMAIDAENMDDAEFDEYLSKLG